MPSADKPPPRSPKSEAPRGKSGPDSPKPGSWGAGRYGEGSFGGASKPVDVISPHSTRHGHTAGGASDTDSAPSPMAGEKLVTEAGGNLLTEAGENLVTEAGNDPKLLADPDIGGKSDPKLFDGRGLAPSVPKPASVDMHPGASPPEEVGDAIGSSAIREATIASGRVAEPSAARPTIEGQSPTVTVSPGGADDETNTLFGKLPARAAAARLPSLERLETLREELGRFESEDRPVGDNQTALPLTGKQLGSNLKSIIASERAM